MSFYIFKVFILKFILTFVFFDNSVQKLSGLHNFSFCFRSQLKILVKGNDYVR